MTIEQQTTTTTTISRRRVAQGAAWAVPVVAVGAAAPNAAASPCTETHTYDWSIYSGGTFPTTINAAGATTTLTVSSDVPAGVPYNNLRVWSGPDGGFPSTAKYLEIALRSDPDTLYSQTVTFTFSAPVTDLLVTLGDIDSGSSTDVFQEAVYITSAAPFTTSTPNGSTLTGSGTQSDPWYATDGISVAPSSDSGNAFAYFVGPVTSFSVTVFDPYPAASGASAHSIDVFNMTFTGC